MKKLFLILVCFFLIIDVASSQTKARSKTGAIGVAEGPAVLTATVEFVEPSGNTFLDGSETGTITIVVSNTGGLDAKSVIAKLTTSSPVAGVTFPSSIPIGNIARGTFAEGHFDLSAAENVKTMSIKFKVEASEESGIKIEPKTITVLTKERVVVKDKTPPLISLTEPIVVSTRGFTVKKDQPDVKTEKSVVTFKGTATDSSGIAMILINSREAQLTLAKEGTNFSGEALLVLGPNDVEVKAIDKYGNEKVLKLTIEREAIVVESKKAIAKDLFKGQRWAVIVGISDYRDPEVPDLRYADRDARSFYELITSPLEEGGGGVSKPNVRYLLNEQATSANIREALADFLKSAIEDDIVYIYFAGHGAPDPDRPKVLYLLTYDSYINRLGGTAIKMQEIQDALRDYVAAKKVIIFADACHSRGVSGAVATRALASADLVNEFLSDIARARASTLTFSASDVDQLSQEDTKWGGGHGVFTHHIIEGLKGKADSDNDKIIRLGELIFYVNDKVRRDTKSQQNPISSGSFDVNLPLTVVP